MKRLTLVALFLVTLVAALTACTAVRLCGIGALNPRRECVFSPGYGGVLVPRGLYPSATPTPAPWRVEIDKRCGRESREALLVAMAASDGGDLSRLAIVEASERFTSDRDRHRAIVEAAAAAFADQQPASDEEIAEYARAHFADSDGEVDPDHLDGG